jgi:hypothetical protein
MQKFWSEKLEENKSLKDIREDRRKISEWILEKWGGNMWTGSVYCHSALVFVSSHFMSKELKIKI